MSHDKLFPTYCTPKIAHIIKMIVTISTNEMFSLFVSRQKVAFGIVVAKVDTSSIVVSKRKYSNPIQYQLQWQTAIVNQTDGEIHVVF